eukprot:CCRYP_008491-RA/>CCRYP_008491-RA protein AED:0.36 eAED:0.36 QI:0/-1/0/1/-1/1/1/0/125
MTPKGNNYDGFDSMETNPCCQMTCVDFAVRVMIKLKPAEPKTFDIKRLKTRFDVETLRRDDPFMYYSIFKYDHDAAGVSSLLQRNSECYGSDSTVKVQRRSRISVECDHITEIMNCMSELEGTKS